MENILLPLGIDSFEELRRNGYYYVDKTNFIEELLQDRFKVNLITRPRRFGKTLAMSMLADFFDIRKDSRAIFAGLTISENERLCREWMNQRPVLSVTFKDIEDLTFTEAYAQLAFVISSLCIEHRYLADSDKVSPADKAIFNALMHQTAKKTDIKNSLLILTRMMNAHYGRPSILLIDEYDVPLAKANEHGHYRQMLNSISGILSTSLKTNPNLQFAVITGCLKISKESIFTGTNHFVSNTIFGNRYQDTFGFTQNDVENLLADTGFETHASIIKQWYDGYHIHDTDIYCPWDVLNYVSDLKSNPNALPGSYWKDTSHNDIIRSFIGQKDFNVTEQLETLLAGGYVKVRLCDDMTYDFIHSSENNFWNVLYLTGYLTSQKSSEAPVKETLAPGEALLQIPNEEIKSIFEETIVQWFRDTMCASDRRPLMDVLWNGEALKASSMLTDLLFQTISYHNYSEDYYHAFLTGIFTGLGYTVESDREHGEGRPDIVVKDSRNRRVMILEAKRSRSRNEMEKSCDTAVNQIWLKKYTRDYLEGYRTILCYGAAFFRKECLLKQFEV